MDDCLANSGGREATTKSGIKSDMEAMFQRQDRNQMDRVVEKIKNKLSQTLDTSVQMTQKAWHSRLEEQNRRFDELEIATRDTLAQASNLAAVMANSHLNRLHAKITPMQVLLHPDDPDRSEWRPHMRDVYRLGQWAKGFFPSKHNPQTEAKERRDGMRFSILFIPTSQNYHLSS